MVLYANIRSEYPLPLTEYQTRVFQTQDVVGWMCDIVITKEGELRQRTENDGEYWTEVIQDIDVGRWTFIRCDKPINFTGTIKFYDLVKKEWHTMGWIEFSADFVDGKLDGNIKVSSHKNIQKA